MLYNSFTFLCFLIIFLTVYFVIRRQWMKELWILTANVVFYVWSGWVVLWIVAATSVIVYLMSVSIGRLYLFYDSEKKKMSPKEQTVLFNCYKKQAKKYLWSGMALILGVWIAVKAGKLLGLDTVTTFYDWIMGRGILVPLGISYYTLSSVGYLLDVYWRKAKPEQNFLRLFTAMTYFPHIVQGPISRYDRLLIQLKNLPAFDYNRVCYGIQRILWGYIKKLVIADRLDVYTSAVFTSLESYAGIEIFLAVIFSIFQLYTDFSGCMDIVCGVSEMIGIPLEENFRQPFLSKTTSEFWARWHITLGAWTKDYIYLPIAMNPKFMKKIRSLKKNGKIWLALFLRAFCPLVAVWLFTGLWHGTGPDYIAWGMYWCILMILAKETKPVCDKIFPYIKIRREGKYYRIWQSVKICLLFGIGRTFTVTGSLSGFVFLWKRFWREARLWVLFDGSLYQHGLDRKDFYIAITGILLILLTDLIHEKGIKIRQKIADQPLLLRWCIYYGAVFVILILGQYGIAYNPSSFVYGRF